MLLEPPNQLLLLVALVGPIDLYTFRSMLWNPMEIHRVVWRNISSNTTGLEGLVAASTGANRATNSNMLEGLSSGSSAVELTNL